MAAVVALIVAAPHLLWLVANDFLPFAYADARALHFKGPLDYVTRPPKFLLSQLGFLVPSLLIAAPYLRRDVKAAEGAAYSADAFDRRIVTLLAFGPVATVVALSLVTGRDTVPLWGYPLWLFLGLWIVLNARRLDRVTVTRIAVAWGIVFAVMAAAFVVAYDVLPRTRDRYIAVLFPGDRLGETMSRRFRAMIGRPLALCDRRHVGRRQHLALRARASARADRRQAWPRAVDRSRRSARQGRGRGLDRRFTDAAALISGCSPTRRKSSRRSRCRCGWAKAA